MGASCCASTPAGQDRDSTKDVERAANALEGVTKNESSRAANEKCVDRTKMDSGSAKGCCEGESKDTSGCTKSNGTCAEKQPILPEVTDCKQETASNMANNDTDGCCGNGESCDGVSTYYRADLHADQAEEQCIQIAAAAECQVACKKPDPIACCTTKNDSGAAEAEKTTSDDSATTHEAHDHAHDHGDTEQDFNQPCSTHLQAAFDKYAAYLEQARCICRSALSSQVDQCCGSTKPLLPPNRSDHAASSTSVHKHASTGNMTRRSGAKPAKPTNTTAKHHGDSCCSGPAKATEKSEIRYNKENPTDTDLERDGHFSHILLSVVGMDCTGCANNLTKALNMPGTRNVQVTFVTGIAELDLDLDKLSVAEVISIAERATRYKITPFSADSQMLSVSMSAEQYDLFQHNLPRGVESCETINKDRYLIAYDPCLIGARNVLTATAGQLLQSEDKKVEDGRRVVIDKLVKTTLAFALTIPVLALTWGETDSVSENARLWTSLVLATLVQAIAYPEFYRPAISSLIYNHVVEMDMLVVISITAAYVYSVVAFAFEMTGQDLETGTLFETSTLLIALVLFGRLLASWARKRAINAVSLSSLQISTARLASGEEIDARLLHMHDLITIQPHTKIVTDAIVTQGGSELDESMITGESLPVQKKAEDTLIAGTLNGSGLLTAKVSRLPGKNTINDIEDLVNQAQKSKPKTQELADRVAGWFVPVVCFIAVVVAIVWGVVATKKRNESPDAATGLAISYAIAVLAISCPCALGLAVPMVLVVAGGRAARGGIVIKSAEVTERGHKVTDVVFDKTGTLTEGTLEVVHSEVMREDILGVVKAMVSQNQHPVSAAVAASINEKPVTVEDVVSVPGAGIEARWNGHLIKAGKPEWVGLASTASDGHTLLCVTIDNEPAATFELKSTLRPEAARVVEKLQKRGITVHIVSGDNASAVAHIASILEVTNTAASRTPAQKKDYVESLSEAGKTVLFCGDGTNDAVAVAQADIGVQIEASSSSDITRATADVVLMSANLEGIVHLLDVCKAAYRRIVFNFVWSAVYNVLAVLLAGGAFVKFRIPPAYAGLGEVVSVGPVIVAALTMPRIKVKKA